MISVPLSFFGGIGGASKQGILVKGGNYLEALAHAGIVVFDKTGTLTRGTFAVQELCPASGQTRESLLELAAYAEHYSDHPIARSIEEAYGKPIDQSRIQNAAEESGRGISVMVDGETGAGGQSAADGRSKDCRHPAKAARNSGLPREKRRFCRISSHRR